jgi:hypothetical protein
MGIGDKLSFKTEDQPTTVVIFPMQLLHQMADACAYLKIRAKDILEAQATTELPIPDLRLYEPNIGTDIYLLNPHALLPLSGIPYGFILAPTRYILHCSGYHASATGSAILMFLPGVSSTWLIDRSFSQYQ